MSPLSQSANEKNELKKQLEEIKDNTGETPEKITADSEYRSSDNIAALEENNIDGYIATGKGEKGITEDKKIYQQPGNYPVFIEPGNS